VTRATYPALVDSSGTHVHSLSGKSSFLVGRSETADLTLLDMTCSRQQFRIVRVEGLHYVEPLSKNSPTYHNGLPIAGRTPLAHEDRLEAGSCSFLYLTGPRTGAAQRPATPVTRPSDPDPPMPTLMADSRRGLPTPTDSLAELTPIALSGKMLIGRDEGRVGILLPHPHVSRIHAHITLQNDKAVLVDLDSANGTYVNGMRVHRSATVRPGDQIDIGPYALQFDGRMLVPRTRSDNVELVARDLRRVVTSRETGKPLVLLDEIALVIRPREFVCLLGPSGSGKSTLLSALSGRTTPDGGNVLLNGQDLHSHFDALKQDIAVVPQKDVLHESLAVGDALWYTARLRLPPDLNREEVTACIDDTLEMVSLRERRGTLIRHLSGGQVKRASLANEILCKPSLLFLDEVTSGLDEQTDREMMNLFRSVAEDGKTVVCITHSLANVERTCHLVVILTAGGRLAFVGKPAEALRYFDIERLGDVYDRLAEKPAEHWQQGFRASPLYRRYVLDRLPRGPEAPPVPVRAPTANVTERGIRFLRQTAMLTQRYFAIWRGDYPALLAMLGQSVLVAVLIGVLFGDLRDAEKSRPIEHARHAVNLLFLLAVTSFWFGCNNAAKEIVKERAIYTRERDFNVRPTSYYCSKLLLLLLFSGVQVVVLAGTVQVWCHPPGSVPAQWVLLGCLAGAGVTLGLAISAAAPTEEMAVTLIPVAVVPQIILSDAIARVSGLSERLAQAFITAYWGNRGLDALLPKDVAAAARLELGSYASSMFVVLAHAGAFMLIGLGVLLWQGRRGRGPAKLLRRD
jgi:ABC-type multidrug transport system ATPase subunit/pSer/pThr/pTyr-binding forkhead associated (FHA) protein